MKLRTFDEYVETDLRDDLNDPEFALGYLQACLEEAQSVGDTGIFLIALRDVARAQESVAVVAERAGKTRTSFYKSLSGAGNPEFATVLRALPTLGMKLQVVPNIPKPRRRKVARIHKRPSELVQT